MQNLLRKPVWIFYILVSYVIIQFSWWLYLIYDLNKKLYSTDLLKTKLLMVLGEGGVFLLVMILGVFLIRRGLNREKKVIELQENFLLSITHELKTPIAAAKLNLQTLQRPNTPIDRKDEILASGLGSVNRLEKLVNNLLLAKSIAAKNYFTNNQDIDLENCVQNIVRFQFSTESHRIEVEASEKGVQLTKDQHALESVLVNLIDNALKYSSEKVEIAIDKTNGKTVVTVSDSGEGIASEQIAFVTRKFYRIENEMTRNSKGTGLGLYLVKELVKRLKGQLKIINGKMSGLTVQITFENEK